jgi:ectoine hydroxylase-related dioxygenase (phytanoyl-CoA dioxygenase family)
MKEFSDSSPLLNDQQALRDRFNRDGYIFLKNAVNISPLTSLRKELLGILQAQGWLKPRTDLNEAIPWTIPHVEGEEEFFKVYDKIQRLESFHALSHHPSVLSKLKVLLGESAFPHPLSIARLVFPDNDDWATPPHQDYPNNQGTEDLYACWIPLSDCPQEMGSLSILEGSHKLGLMPLKFSLGAGHRQADLDSRFEKLNWVASDFELGDMLIFHSLTVHRSLANSRDCMRLSVDYRFQRENEPLTDSCLHPHFQRESWDEIYQDWKDKSLKYYWRNKSYQVADWDSNLHNIPEETEADAIREKVIYDRKRQNKKSHYE